MPTIPPIGGSLLTEMATTMREPFFLKQTKKTRSYFSKCCCDV